MTKEEIDKYFTDNWNDIQKIVKSNSLKCATINALDITSEIYLICIDKATRITNLSGFIRILSSNIYRWEKSNFNKENGVFHEEINFNDIYTEGLDVSEEIYQERMYQLALYFSNASPSERAFYDLYVNQGVTTYQGIQEKLDITYYAARILINEFKQKVKSYER